MCKDTFSKRNDFLGLKGASVNRVRRNDFVRLFADFFDILLYKFPPKPRPSTVDYSYKDNQSFWEDAIKGAHFEEMRIHLRNFHLTEWLPSAPGRYFTEEAVQSRIEAKHFFDPTKGEYRPFGKLRMVLGGVGSLRLGAKLVDAAYTHFLGASSTGVTHEGIPVAMSKEQFRCVIDPIKKNGGCITNLTGSLRVLPTSISTIQYDRDIPRYCFFVDEFDVIEPSSEDQLLANVAIMFPSKYYHYDDRENPELIMGGYTTNMIKMWSFCSFKPSSKNSLKNAVDWLKDYASRHSGMENPPIFTNFDECYQHFENPIEFSIAQLFQNDIDMVRLNAYMSYSGLTINIGELRVKDIFNNISNSTIINRSSVEKSFNRIQEKYDKETAMALLQVAQEIEKSGNKEAAELFENFNEEIQKPKPRRSVLRSVWEGIEKALPSVLEITDIAIRISKILSGRV